MIDIIKLAQIIMQFPGMSNVGRTLVGKLLKSVQSTLSHLITTSVPRAMLTHFLVEHGLSQYYLFKDLPGVELHNLMNISNPLTFSVEVFQ